MIESLASGSAAHWAYALALLVLGFVLMLLEVFVIPGLNIFGIMGLLAAVAGVYFAYAKLGLFAAVVVAGIGLLGTLALVRTVLKMRGWQRLVLSSSTSRAGGYSSSRSGREELLGQCGQALTPLRPSGRALFGEQSVDVVTEGGFVERGMAVEVVRVAGNRVVVNEVDDPVDPTPPS